MKRWFSRQMVRFTGFKVARVGEWRQIVAQEAKTLGWGTLVIELAKGALGLGGVDRRRWRARMRACRACPIYDARRRACRDTEARGLGCGCWMPAKALIGAGACWIRGLGETTYGFD